MGNLADALIGVILGVADDSILDKYSDIRIKVYDVSSVSSASVLYPSLAISVQSESLVTVRAFPSSVKSTV